MWLFKKNMHKGPEEVNCSSTPRQVTMAMGSLTDYLHHGH